MENLPLGLTYDDVLLRPGKSLESRSLADTSTTLPYPNKVGYITLKVPILSANMADITEQGMAAAMYNAGGLGIIHRFCRIDHALAMWLICKQTYTPVFMSIGVNDKERITLLADTGCKAFCIDVANGYSDAVARTIEYLRTTIPGVVVMAGNVATREGALFLMSAGADIIKAGIGPGSCCTTRLVTGCGMPQLSAIAECAEVAHYLIADGGIRGSGDIVKALTMGADAVMIGKLLAGTPEAPGKPIYNTLTASSSKIYSGSASKKQQDKCDMNGKNRTTEGVTAQVQCAESTIKVVTDLLKGIRSGMSYVGAQNLAELRMASFIRVTQSGYTEGLPHALLNNTM